MSNPDDSKLGAANAAFALSAAIVVLFNTVVACAKDAYSPLKLFMASLSDHDWTTQGLVDVILFVGLGMVLLKTGMAEKIGSRRLVSILAGAVVVAGLSLFAWYALT